MKVTKAHVREAAKRAVRTFVPAFLVLFIPGMLGWLNDLTQWAGSEGATPFPDAHGLAYLAVAATVAGVISVVNLAMILVEDATGVKILRKGGGQ